VKYAFIKDHSDTYEVRRMCRVLMVSPSGYYSWRTRPLSRRELFDRYLLNQIRQVHVASRQNYGAIKTWKALTANGIRCGKHRVARIRRIHGIQSKRRRRFKVTTLSKNTEWIAPNRLNRCFQVAKPNQTWVGDVTFIATRGGWLYLAVLLDLYSRKIIGWAMSEQINKQLVVNALDMALERRQPQAEVIHHTDRGSIYGSDEYRSKLAASGLIPSMSRKGDCYDNAVAESFFSTLKNELLYGERFISREQAKSEIFKFMEIFYNRQRLHQSLNYVTPEMAESEVVF
jgi:putative transposase